MTTKWKKEAFDRMSSLPVDTVHHIMGFLSASDVARFSTLSKTLRSVWETFPIIIFDQHCFEKSLGVSHSSSPSISEQFLSHVYDRIHKEGFQNSGVLQKFILHAILHAKKNYKGNKYMVHFDPDRQIDEAISFAIGKDVKVLDLHLYLGIEKPSFIIYQQAGYYKLPNTVYCAKSITAIDFHGFQLGLCELIQGCPLIQNLRLSCCTLLLVHDQKDAKVSSSKLKQVELDCCSYESVEIEASNLESFLYNNTKHGASNHLNMNIDISACKRIKKLTLKHASISDEWLKDHLCEFVGLESLKLEGCDVLKSVEVSHEKLRSLELVNCMNVEEVKVDSVGLVSFFYCGDQVVPFSLMNSPALSNTKISLNSNVKISQPSFVVLRNFLAFLGHSKALTLVCHSDEFLIFPEELRDSLLPPLYDLSHLRIEIQRLNKSYAELVDRLLWLCPNPEVLTLVLGLKEKSIKFHYDIKGVYKEGGSCCRDGPIKCWRHYLKMVEMNNFEDDDNNEMISLVNYFLENAKGLKIENNN